MDTIKAMQVAAKKIAKSEKLFIINRENKYFILDGYFMLAVNDTIYNTVFRSADVAFCEVPEGKQASRNNKEDQMLRVHDNPTHVEQFFINGSVQSITKTRFFVNISNGKKEYPASVFATDNNNFIVVNNKFLEYITPFCGNNGFIQPDNIEASKEAYSPIYSREWVDINSPDFIAAAMVLPIRNEIKSFDFTIRKNGTEEQKTRSTEKAEIKADAIISDAKREAARIIEEAEAIHEEAMKYTKEIIEKAKKEAEQIIEQAKSDNVQIRSDAITKATEEGKMHEDLYKDKAEQIIKEAEEKAANIIALAEEEKARIIAETEDGREIILDSAKAEAAETIKAADREAEQTITTAKAEAEHIINTAFEKQNKIITEAEQAIKADREQKPEQITEKASATIKRNEDKNGIEIYFNSFPAASIREQLKQNGYKWHSGKRCWYAKATPDHLTIAEQITGIAA